MSPARASPSREERRSSSARGTRRRSAARARGVPQSSRPMSSTSRRWLSRACARHRGDEARGVARREGLDDRRVLGADQVEVRDAAALRPASDARLVVERIERSAEGGVARAIEQRLVEALVVVDERHEIAVVILAVVAGPDARVDLAQAARGPPRSSARTARTAPAVSMISRASKRSFSSLIESGGSTAYPTYTRNETSCSPASRASASRTGVGLTPSRSATVSMTMRSSAWNSLLITSALSSW